MDLNETLHTEWLSPYCIEFHPNSTRARSNSNHRGLPMFDLNQWAIARRPEKDRGLNSPHWWMKCAMERYSCGAHCLTCRHSAFQWVHVERHRGQLAPITTLYIVFSWQGHGRQNRMSPDMFRPFIRHKASPIWLVWSFIINWVEGRTCSIHLFHPYC
jgi:hypothetical protein